ncbi:hypothetical protein L596_011281 [Steinernema carpocapsae]|uniref:Uncharacterized protein n=1 Tax=Steinernema carpocapsae TaxID=34508 RepID=A0A4U5NTE1_STECR|nr:hypothetical protein L596_011281 [Steinernema carpocapsae]
MSPVFLFLLLSLVSNLESASVRKTKHVFYDERVHGGTVVYRPKTYHTYRTHFETRNYYSPSQVHYNAYHSYPYYQQSYYPSYPYGGYSGGYGGGYGGGAFGFCLLCFGFG